MKIMDLVSTMSSRLAMVGSRATCTPAPMDTDEDWLVLLLPNSKVQLEILLGMFGYVEGGSEDCCNMFTSFNHPSHKYNFILTDNKEWHDKFMLATKIAKKLNLMQKDDRIDLFNIILEVDFDLFPRPEPMLPSATKIFNDVLKEEPLF